MRSAIPKVLHPIAGRSLVAHVLHAVTRASVEKIAVVVGPDHGRVQEETRRIVPAAQVFVQHERRGTAHAVLQAADAIADGVDEVLVLFGDTPLITPETLTRLREGLRQGSEIVVLGFRPVDPTGYGRLLVDNGRLTAIREEKDTKSEAERRIGLCNAGVMALSGRHALDLLRQIGNANAKGEYYLTDVVEIAGRSGLTTSVVETGEDEVRGINTRAQLAQAEAELQKRLRAAAMEGGATLVAPETVFLSTDTKLGRDVVIEPNVVFGPGVVVEDDAVVHAFSHLEGAHIGRGASVGPFARLRPGTVLGAKTRIGNFVETKAASIEDGAKVNHLTYIGDARVGAGANVGAGTITCNYDGAAKHRTEIGANAFIGSNTALVAPVSVGEGAYIGSGSVITNDVPADALAVGRGRQIVKEGWAKQARDKQKQVKEEPQRSGTRAKAAP
jgi:bifunctional UDP-N-acetylglucosamine pyrophosphorylase/glucosamine-1-phosphate N-acetyltransferase